MSQRLGYSVQFKKSKPSTKTSTRRSTNNPEPISSPLDSRKQELIKADPMFAMLSNTSKLASPKCKNHMENLASYRNKRKKGELLCVDCAFSSILKNSKIMIDEFMTENETYKRIEAEAFLDELRGSLSQLNEDVSRTTHALDELDRKHRNSLGKVNGFFEQVSIIFNEAYSKLLAEKIANFQSIQKQHDTRKASLVESISFLLTLENDITSNYENIVLGMDIEPFKKIMGEYLSQIESIQKFIKKGKSEEFPIYRELVESPIKLEAVNNSIQACIDQIFELFDPQLAKDSSKGSLVSIPLDSVEMNEEIEKINECFYASTFTRSKLDNGMKYFIYLR